MNYVIRTVPAQRLVARTAVLDPSRMGGRIGPMFDEVAAALRHVEGALRTPVATYQQIREGTAVAVGYVYDGPPPAGTQVVELPEVEAACGIHLGPPDTIRHSWRTLHRWVESQGHTPSGPCREVYVRAESADGADWITELQQPVTVTTG